VPPLVLDAPPAHQMPADLNEVSDAPNPDLKAAASGYEGSAAVETSDNSAAAPEPPTSAPSSETSPSFVDRARHMTKEEFMKASIENHRALV